jgi:hypothetical protein
VASLEFITPPAVGRRDPEFEVPRRETNPWIRFYLIPVGEETDDRSGAVFLYAQRDQHNIKRSMKTLESSGENFGTTLLESQVFAPFRVPATRFWLTEPHPAMVSATHFRFFP